MKTSLHRILTEDSLELVGLLYEPETSTKKVLVHVHGMAGNFYENKFLDYIAETLALNDTAFFTFNNRGCELVKDLVKIENQKRKIVRVGNAYEIFEDCLVDIKAVINFISRKGFSEIHLSGHSLGSPKVAYYASEEKDERLKSVIFLSPSDMIGLIKGDKNHERNMAMSKKMIAEGKGKELLPFPVLWDESPLSAQTYVSLGDKESRVAIFNFHNSSDTLSVLSRIAIPALTVMGRKDDALVVPIEETMNRTIKALSNSSRAEAEVLGDADHGYNGFEQNLADALNGWIRSFEV